MYGLILAGGSGTRLWPLSRELYPKQLLKLNSDKSLLERTFERMMSVCDTDNILAITNAKNYSDVRAILSKFNEKICVLPEPVAKSTAPAIAITAKYLLDRKEDDLILVAPSDHLINDIASFEKTIQKAKELALEGYIVTLGQKPQKPSCRYGYIITDGKIKDGYKVSEFKEKPDEKAASEYIKQENCYWNCGIFLFKASVLMKTIKECASDIFGVTEKFDFSANEDINYIEFNKYPAISFDHAILERANNVAMVEMSCDWTDLGSWEAIYEINKKDEKNNVIIGAALEKDCENSMLYSSGRVVAGVGLKDVVIVETNDAVLACNRNEVESVKDIFEKLKEAKNDTHRIHKTVYRPWGYYTVLDQGEGYLTKLISVSRKGQLSLQSHNFRSEHWVVLSGCARVTLGDKTFMLKAGASIDIPTKAIHSLANPFDTELRIMEVQKGEKLIEEDIIRYKDIYGRA